jgi:Xaa-Pro aminopeptidase
MNIKLKALRQLMKRHRVRAYLIPSADPHQSEYVPECWKRRQFVTGFTGSAGDAVVTLDKAGLWADSRYHLQAERELRGSEFRLFKLGLPGTPTWLEWLVRELRSGQKLGLDPRLISHQSYEKLQTDLGRRGISIKSIGKNLVDGIWPQQPETPRNSVVIQPQEYAGESVKDKLGRLRRKMAEDEVDAHVLTTLDAIAWLFNIRGADVEFNPVAVAYATVTRKKAALFIDRKKLSRKIEFALSKNIEIRPYDNFPTYLLQLGREGQRVWLDETSVSQWVVDELGKDAALILKPSPVALFKAVKNKAEIAGAKAAHTRDGAAMVQFLYWLEKEVLEGGVTELSAARKLEEFRSLQPLFRGLSFRTISSYGEHGAVVHYSVSPETDLPIKPKGIYLVDSGSQYLDATTDITRTIALGKTTDEQRDRFTLVLKGLIALSTVSFPQGTSGPQLDILARKALWEKGLNYGHGTGHGIGAYLNVHEGPQSIAPARGTGIALEPGMILSVEPGFYKDGEYGLRLENLVLVVKDEARSKFGSAFYAFETLTLCPIDLRLVKRELLRDSEVRWLNSYHHRVRRALTPLLSKPEAAWLARATAPLGRKKRLSTKGISS